jgi:LPXTG-motif cell wall-anchored protein
MRVLVGSLVAGLVGFIASFALDTAHVFNPVVLVLVLAVVGGAGLLARRRRHKVRSLP